MSDEKKTSDVESADENGLFDSLIKDFKLEGLGDPPEIPKEDKFDVSSGLKSFSKFFEDATASGSGFESIIDKDSAQPQETPSDTLSFSAVSADTESVKNKQQIITEPVTDEDGMIVIYDEEAGIDATSFAADDDTPVEIGTDFENDSDEETTVSKAEDDFGTDSNISEADEAAAPVPENAPSDTEVSSDEPKKRSFIQGILPWKGDSVGEIIRKIVFIASTGVFVAAGIMLLSTINQSEEMIEEAEEIKSMVTTTVATSINESNEVVTIPPTTEEREEHNESVMQDFIDISGNVKGFIEMPSLDIYLPVVQGTDNDYYLTHTYDDKKNKAGSIFIDYRCTISEDYTSPNIVLYGHNQEDGTMFGRLKYYKNNVDFYKHSPYVTFNTEYGIGDYVIFGYFVTNVHKSQDAKGEVFHYHDYIETLNTETTFDWYMKEVAERNQIISPVDVKFGDKLLVLSTCSNEYSDSRFVVLARKLRPGEVFAQSYFDTATLNPNAKQIDWDVILSENSVTTTTVPETTAETTTVPTTTPTEATTEETTTETTSETTVPHTVPTKADFSQVSLAPQIHNGTTASSETITEETSESESLAEGSDETSVETSETASETTVSTLVSPVYIEH